MVKRLGRKCHNLQLLPRFSTPLSYPLRKLTGYLLARGGGGDFPATVHRDGTQPDFVTAMTSLGESR
jgi:hypothetical protein